MTLEISINVCVKELIHNQWECVNNTNKTTGYGIS